MGICFSFIRKRQKGRINDWAEKRPAPCWGEREGSNLIWLEEDVCVGGRAHVCVRTCMAALHSVRGLWEWDRRAALLNGASRARSSGESPQTR